MAWVKVAINSSVLRTTWLLPTLVGHMFEGVGVIVDQHPRPELINHGASQEILYNFG